MRNFKCNEPIEVLGVTFNGVNEMLKCAFEKTPKEGVYVGTDCQRYPCFDSSDYAYEDRYFTNIVFAESAEELQRKMRVLENWDGATFNYNKLTGKLHPMAYWRGEPFYDVILSDADDE